jgi:tetratricopeptide (TPR) repeat protein
VAEALVEQAAARYRSGDYPSAADMLGRADTVYRQKDAGAEVMARYYEVLSWVQLEHGTLPLALVASQKALALSTQVFGENHKKTIEALSAFARVEVKMGNFEAAIQHLQDALTRSDHASGVTPLETLAIHSDISRAEFNAGRFAAVADRLQAQAPRCEQLVDPQGESCVGLRQRQAVALLLLGQHKEALALLPALLPMTANTESPNRAAEAMIAACRVLTLNDRPQDHLQLWVALRVLGDSGPEVKQREAVKIQALWVQAEMLLHAGKPLAAQGILQRAETRATNANDRRATARLHLMQGMAWQSQGQFELALRELRTGAQEYAKLVGENHPITLLVTANQVRSLWAVQRSGEALALLDHAMPVLQDALGYQAPTFLKLRALRDTVARTPIPDSPAARKVDFFL